MAGRWDGGAPGLCGPDFFPRAAGSTVIDSAAKAVGIACLPQLASANLLQVGIHPGAFASRGGLYTIEGYQSLSAAIGAKTTVVAYPNADISGGGAFLTGGWTTQAGATTNLWSAVDEPSLDTSDYIQSFGYAPYYPAVVPYRFRFTAPSFAGRRILTVKLVVWGLSYYGGNLVAGLTIGGVDYVGINAALTASNKSYEYTWQFNPATGLPWTIADVASLNTTNGGYISIAGGSYQYPFIYAINLPVVSCAENRTVVGIYDDRKGGLIADGSAGALVPNAWNTTPVTTPTGGVATKPAGGTPQIWVVRRLNSVGSMALTYLDPGAVRPFEFSFIPTLDSDGAVTNIPPTLSPLYGLRLVTTGPVNNADGQPYVSVLSGSWVNAYFGASRQEFSDCSSQTYARLKFRAYPADGITAPLVVTCHRSSDDVQMGGSFTLTVAQANALAAEGPLGYKAISGRLSSVATLVAGTKYYLKFSSTEPGPTPRWIIEVLYDELIGDEATFGGTTDAAWSSARGTWLDIPVTLGASALDPTVPTGFTATVHQLTVDAALGGTTLVDYVHLAWTGTAMGASFARIDIARTIDGGATYQLIGRVVDESLTFRDVIENERGVSIGYRIQSVNTEGAESGWTATQYVTTSTKCCELVIGSDSDLSLTVAFDTDPKVDYQPGDNSVLIPLANLDYGVAELPTERPSTVGRWILKVAAGGTTPPGGRFGYDAFAKLLALYRAQGVTIPYVWVGDRHGRAWRGLLRLPNGFTEEGNVERYLAQIELHHFHDTPFVVETTAVPA